MLKALADFGTNIDSVSMADMVMPNPLFFCDKYTIDNAYFYVKLLCNYRMQIVSTSTYQAVLNRDTLIPHDFWKNSYLMSSDRRMTAKFGWKKAVASVQRAFGWLNRSLKVTENLV